MLRRVEWSKDLDDVRSLFQGYREWLARHASRAGSPTTLEADGLSQIDRQVSELPGAYGPPRGDVILAFREGEIVACGALREWAPAIGEIKRIYVRADHQGPGFGPILTRALLDRARALGFASVRVDTLSSMAGAIGFYQRMGFRPIPGYWPHPVPGARFFERSLHERSRKKPQ